MMILVEGVFFIGLFVLFIGLFVLLVGGILHMYND